MLFRLLSIGLAIVLMTGCGAGGSDTDDAATDGSLGFTGRMHGNLARLHWQPDAEVDQYNVHLATDPDVDPDLASVLPGGQSHVDVTPPLEIAGLESGVAHYLVLEARQGGENRVSDPLTLLPEVSRFLYVYSGTTFYADDDPAHRRLNIYAVQPGVKLPTLHDVQDMPGHISAMARDPETGRLYLTLLELKQLLVTEPDPVTGRLTILQTLSTGVEPVDIALSHAAERLVVANATSEDLSLYTLAPDGDVGGSGLRQSLGHAPSEAAFAHDGRYLAVGFRGPGQIGLFDSMAESTAMPESDRYQVPKDGDITSLSQLALHPYRHQLLYAARGGPGNVFGSVRVDADDLTFGEAFTVGDDYPSGGRVILFPDGKKAVMERSGGANASYIADLDESGEFTLRSPHIQGTLGPMVAGPENDRFYGGSAFIETLVPVDSDPGFGRYRHGPTAPDWERLVPNPSFETLSLLSTGDDYPAYRPAAVWALNTESNRLERYPIDPDSQTLMPTMGGTALNGDPVGLAITPAGYIAVIGTTWVEVFSYNTEGIVASIEFRNFGYTELNAARFNRSGSSLYLLDSGAESVYHLQPQSSDQSEQALAAGTPLTMDMSPLDTVLLISKDDGALEAVAVNPLTGAFEGTGSVSPAEVTVGTVSEITAMSDGLHFMLRDDAGNMQMATAIRSSTGDEPSLNADYDATAYAADTFHGLIDHPLQTKLAVMGFESEGDTRMRGLSWSPDSSSRSPTSATPTQEVARPLPGAIDRSGRFMVTLSEDGAGLELHELSPHLALPVTSLDVLDAGETLTEVVFEDRLE